MPSKLVFDLQGAERMTSDMAPKPTFRRENSENLLRVAPVDPPNFWIFFFSYYPLVPMWEVIPLVRFVGGVYTIFGH